MLPIHASLVTVIAAVVVLLLLLLPSLRIIAPNEVGLVIKRLSRKKLAGGNLVAFRGEAGYQADLLMPGIRFKAWWLYSVDKHPFVQVPSGEIGLVIAQVGEALPVGCKTAAYKGVFGDFSDLRKFMENGGQKGVQRQILSPGSVVPIHPLGFLVITRSNFFGVPVDPVLRKNLPQAKERLLRPYGITEDNLVVTVIAPHKIERIETRAKADLTGSGERSEELVDVVGIVTTLEGPPLPAGDIAGRLGGFEDVGQLEPKLARDEPIPEGKLAEAARLQSESSEKIAASNTARLAARSAAKRARQSRDAETLHDAEEKRKVADQAKTEADQAIERANRILAEIATEASKADMQLIELLLGSKNIMHNNYQDFQAFLDHGGCIGLQHDPLLYGAYNLNPVLVKVEMVPMLMVKQGQVAVIKSYVGLVAKDVSGMQFKHGSLVRPGHRGIWQEALRTGKYPINPRCYEAEIVPTAILTLNWADAISKAHNLDRELRQIDAKSREGFIFHLDLQVQIHVPDTKAARVISRVGTMQNLINEVLQAAVGNHFRDTLQAMPAIDFIETRQEVQEDAFHHIRQKLSEYEVETPGVYIQDVVLPEQLVKVLTEREIANQEVTTFQRQEAAQQERIRMEQATGRADKQHDLASSAVQMSIAANLAEARKSEASGEAEFIAKTGAAKGAEVESVNVAFATAYDRQVKAIGQQGTILVNIARALAASNTPFVPRVLVSGGEGGAMNALFATLTEGLSKFGNGTPGPEKTVSEETVEESSEMPRVPDVPPSTPEPPAAPAK
jgi:regulator of protease activity HflC (stomatin/prohibitin superfamily)